MPLPTGFTIPTLAVLIARISADLNSRLPGQDALIRRSVMWVLARVLAGAVWGLYQYDAAIAEQILVDSATSETLTRHGLIWGIPRGQPELADNGVVTFSGVPATAIPLGQVVQRDDGVQYETTVAGVIGGGGTVAIAAQAIEAGADGNAVALTALTVVSPPVGCASTAEVTTAFTTGEDEETDTSLRERILDRIRDTPQGGAMADYVAWAKAAIEGTVDRVWAQGTWAGAGTVRVLFTVNDGGAPTPIPAAGQITDVDEYINGTVGAGYLDARRPITANVTVAAPVANAIDFTITLLNLDPAEVIPAQDAILLAMAALHQREGAPSATIANSHYRDVIQDAIDTINTAGYFTLDSIDGDGTGLSNITNAANEVTTVGTPTWV